MSVDIANVSNRRRTRRKRVQPVDPVPVPWLRNQLERTSAPGSPAHALRQAIQTPQDHELAQPRREAHDPIQTEGKRCPETHHAPAPEGISEIAVHGLPERVAPEKGRTHPAEGRLREPELFFDARNGEAERLASRVCRPFENLLRSCVLIMPRTEA